MILVCPQCRTGFQIPDDAVGPGGRRVRCGACAHVWHAGSEIAEPPDRPPAPEPERDPEPPTGPPPEREPAAAPEPEFDPPPLYSGPAYGDARLPALTGRQRPWIALGWAAWMAFIVGLAIAVFGFRAQMQAAWPPIAGLYELLGIGEAAPAAVPRARDVLSVRIDPDPAWEDAGGSWTLTVTGAIVSRADTEIALPAMILHLVDDRERTLRRVRLESPAPVIAARGTLRFEIRVPDAPAETAAIVHVWEQGD